MSRRCTRGARPNLSTAWSRTFLDDVRSAGRELSPFLVSIAADANGQPVEDVDLRHALDACLEESGSNRSIRSPRRSSRRRCGGGPKGDRRKLYKRLPGEPAGLRVDGADAEQPGPVLRPADRLRHQSKDGTPGGPSERAAQGGRETRSEFIINACKPKAMRMALQASIYDPVRDQTDARQHFPCLQHVAFVPDFDRQDACR